MIWLTHAIGGSTSLILAKTLAPDYFAVNIWLIIFSFYVAQLPDIDIKNSSISKNILIKPIRFLLSPFIDWHRAKQTHSFFWTFFYLLLTLPFILLFWVSGWLLLWIAYFSHVFLDYFNPTWVKLFYVPFLNSEPRAWSLYNTPVLLASEIPYLLKKIFIWNKKSRKKIKRKEIKFDWVWVMTWQWFEKFITYSLWISFIWLIIYNYKELQTWFLLDSVILSTFPTLFILIYLILIIQERKNVIKHYKQFSIFTIVGSFLWLLWFFNILNWKIFEPFENYSISTIFIFIFIFSLLPLLFLLSKHLVLNLINLPKMVINDKKATSSFNSLIKYPTLVHLLLLILLTNSILNLNGYNSSINDNYKMFENTTKETFIKNLTNWIKEQYINSYKTLETKINLK